jgi:RNA:NAD 2'-phosphotransferase (TPT1/KptA family)
MSSPEADDPCDDVPNLQNFHGIGDSKVDKELLLTSSSSASIVSASSPNNVSANSSPTSVAMNSPYRKSSLNKQKGLTIFPPDRQQTDEEILYGKQLKEILRRCYMFFDLFMDTSGYVVLKYIIALLEIDNQVYKTFHQLVDYYDSYECTSQEEYDIKDTVTKYSLMCIGILDKLRGLKYHNGQARNPVEMHKIINKIVNVNCKNRFQIDRSNGYDRIRAVQGQGPFLAKYAKLQFGTIFPKAITKDNIGNEKYYIHATTADNLDKIASAGALSRMLREHIHLSKHVEGNLTYRTTCPIICLIDIQACLKHKIEFFEARNEVILSSGRNNDGCIPLQFIEVIKNTHFQDPHSDIAIYKFNQKKSLISNSPITSSIIAIEHRGLIDYSDKMPHAKEPEEKRQKKFVRPALSIKIANLMLNDDIYTKEVLACNGVDIETYSRPTPSPAGTPMSSRPTTPVNFPTIRHHRHQLSSPLVASSRAIVAYTSTPPTPMSPIIQYCQQIPAISLSSGIPPMIYRSATDPDIVNHAIEKNLLPSPLNSS